MISPRTYSSAVLFSTVMQDCGFGTLAGTGGGARSTQSGGTQNITLPNTQMTMVVPRFVLDRSSGSKGLLQPDVLVVDDPFSRWRRSKLSCATHADTEVRTADSCAFPQPLDNPLTSHGIERRIAASDTGTPPNRWRKRSLE